MSDCYHKAFNNIFFFDFFYCNKTTKLHTFLNVFFLSQNLKLIHNLEYNKQKIIYPMELVDYCLLVLSLSLFSLSRILDDMSWYDMGVPNQVNAFEGTAVTGMILVAILQFFRKRNEPEIVKTLLFQSQIKFIIPWSLITTICLLFFNIFGCYHHPPEHQSQQSYFAIDFTGCCINVVQIILTNFNYSLLCNRKCHLAELIACQMFLFAEIIFNGNLLMIFIDSLEGKVMDYSILLISLAIANQILIMDLNFRAAYEDKKREEEFLAKVENKSQSGKQTKLYEQQTGLNLMKTNPANDILTPA